MVFKDPRFGRSFGQLRAESRRPRTSQQKAASVACLTGAEGDAEIGEL